MPGPNRERLVDIKERTGEQPGYPTMLTTGDERVLIDPDWNAAGRVFVRQAHPLPATILGTSPTSKSEPEPWPSRIPTAR